MRPETARTVARVIAGFLAGLMILSLLLSLVGCGSREEPAETPENEVVENDDAIPEETPKTEEKIEPEDTHPAEEPLDDPETVVTPDTGDEQPVEEEPSVTDTPVPEPQPELPVEPDEAAPAEPETPAAPAVVSPDENGMMQVEGTWIEAPGALNTTSIQRFAQKLQNIRSTYLGGAASVAWSIIPDKSNFVGTRVSESLNHADMVSRARAGLSDMTYVEIGDTLNIDSYLLTDGHWKQECIVPAANKLASAFGFSVSAGSFTTNGTNGFGGDYAKYSGTTEPISWLESVHTKATVCDNFQNPGRTAVYDPALLKTNSPYDLFSGGPTPLVTLKNSAVTTGKRLILFRDSFGSSMAPLLLEGYSEIVMVDLRYMASTLLPQYVDASGADVLFLYSARVVNNSAMLR